MTYITGDTHGEFGRIAEFCTEVGTTVDDVLIILGDAGINYYLDESDRALKEELATLPVTLFCIHGNHEERPYLIDGYEEVEWHGGIVYREAAFPTLLFAKDGEIYDFDGKSAVVIGGAYSVDKYSRLRDGLPWFASEQPSDEIMEYVEQQLERANWRVDYVFTHTSPKQYEPIWAFLPIDQSAVDTTTEDWLSEIEARLDYEAWYCGHFHVDSIEGPIHILYTDIMDLW